MECPICVSKISKTKVFTCPACSYTTCHGCQKMYFETQPVAPSCMNCRMDFTRKFLSTTLGVTFASKTLSKVEKDRLLEREKSLLMATQPLVDWEREVRRIADLSRFGRSISPPPKPTNVVRRQPGPQTQMKGPVIVSDFPCTQSECRGFVNSSMKCQVCKEEHCNKCRVIVSKHKSNRCNPDDIASLNAINEDSRPCPNCCALTHKTFGCNHMKCVWCGVHWDWASAQVLTSSSNQHYSNIQSIAKNVATRREGLCDEEEEHHDDILYDSVPLERYNEEPPKEIVNVLYSDLQAIRLTKTTIYDEHRRTKKTSDSLEKFRVKYLMNEITEASWKTQIYKIQKQSDRDMHYASIIALYLTLVRDLQRIYHSTRDTDNVISQWVELVNMCNEGFASVAEEYGGTPPKLRSDPYNEVPAITI
jgi:hypothetical protein